MKITQFKKMLAVYGADTSRWEDADPAAVRAFMQSSPEAQALYHEAEKFDRALNSFMAPAVDPELLDRTMRKIDGVPETVATVHRFEPQRRKAALDWRPVYWAGFGAACAAAVILFVVPSVRQDVHPAPQGAVVAVAEPEVDTLLAELDKIAEEEIAAQEIIAMLEGAGVGEPAASMSPEEIDIFLEEFFSGEMAEQPPR